MTTLETASTSSLGRALHGAVLQLRAHLSDPSAPIALLVPAASNGVLARRALATQGPVLRVWFETADGLLRQQLPVDIWRQLQPESPGWLRVTLANELQEANALGRFGATLRRSGWRDPLLAALSRLERDAITASDLRALSAKHAPKHVLERAELLATLLDAIAARRTKEGIASPGEITQRAIDASEPGVAAALATGAVVVGDRELSASLHQFLTSWLAKRPVVRIVCPPFGNLPPAPRGMRSACPAAAGEIEVDTSALPRSLATLSRSLFSPPSTAHGAPAPVDDSVVIAHTPDDVRECVECVRVVQRAIEDGVPLDRIAIVLPDGDRRGPLEEALERADIPTTWLVGHAAHDLLPARLLRLALEVAQGDDSVLRIYELLSHPTLDLRSQLGPDAVKGRGRWRRLLGKIDRARGLERIANAIEAMPVDEGDRVLTDEEREREVASRASLVKCTRTLDAELRALDVKGQLGQHARAWASFLKRFARVSDVRAKLLALLDPWSTSNTGPSLTRAQAFDELTSLLDREVARGNLSERSIRVLPPMYLVGGEVDVVCILGLTEGRFPKAAKEDPLLPDELLEALQQTLDRPMPLARSREDLERRRFAAAIGAARKQVWLSVPGLSFKDERPALPSTLLLEAASALLGRRARFSDLSALAVKRGSRAQSWPKDPRDAVDVLEHLIARLAAKDAGALEALGSHTTSRGVLQLHRSIARAHTGVVDAWTGLVSPSTLAAPGLDGAALSATALVELLKSLGDFFFHQMLRAYPARSLKPWTAPLERPQLEDILVTLACDATVNDPDPAKAIAAGAIAHLEAQRALGAFEHTALERARPVVGALGRALAESASDFLRSALLEGPLQIADDLPWTLSAAEGRIIATETGTALADVQRKKPERKTLVRTDRADLTLSAMALSRAKRPVDELIVFTPSNGSAGANVADVAPFVLAALRVATTSVQAGRFTLAGADAFALASERKPPDDASENDEEDAQ